MRKAGWILAGLLAWGAAPVVAQESGQVGELAQLLQLEDRREFDLAALQRAAQDPDSLIRGQAALAVGRIGDQAGVPLLLRLLDDADTTVRAQAAFAMGMLRDSAAAEELARRVAALPDTATGTDAVELVTALCKTGGEAAARAIEALLVRHPPTGPAADYATGIGRASCRERVYGTV